MLPTSNDRASPGLKAGRGLKRGCRYRRTGAYRASPGLKAGRGLKRHRAANDGYLDHGIARPQGRAWIETRLMSVQLCALSSIARPQGRARIETSRRPSNASRHLASPGLKAGRGLKRITAWGYETESTRIARPQGRARIETRQYACGSAPTREHRPASRPGAD